MKELISALAILAALGLAGSVSWASWAQGEDPVPALAQGTSGSPLVGFETGNAMEVAAVDRDSYLASSVVRSGSGMFCYRAGGGATAILAGMAADAVGARFSYRTSDAGSSAQIFYFTNGITTQVYITLDGKTGKLYARSSQVGLNDGNPVYGQTVLASDTWYTVRVAYDAAAGGVVRLWVNDVLEIDTTHVLAGLPVTDARISGNARANNYFDDFWIGDSAEAPPLGQIVRLAPDGGLVAWDKSGGFARVDEIVPRGGTNEENIHAGVNDITELYTLQDPAIPAAAAVNAVKAMWQMKRSSGPASDHRYVWLERGVLGDSGPVTLPTKGYATFSRIFDFAPAGGPWDVGRLAAFEIGARHAAGPQDTYLSWAVVMVDYFNPY